MIFRLLLISVLIVNSSSDNYIERSCTDNITCIEKKVEINRSENSSTTARLDYNVLCSECYGNSVCTTDTVGKSVCICPPDYEGRLCDKLTTDHSGSCSENSCKNGGNCVLVGNVNRCNCTMNYAGEDCSRTALLFRISLQITSMEQMKIQSVDGKKDIEKQNIPQYGDVCLKIRNYLKVSTMPEMAVLLTSCKVISVSNITNEQLNITKHDQEGQLKIILRLKFDTGKRKLPINKEILQKQIFDGFAEFQNSSGQISVAKSEFNTEEVDYCKESHHDCSPFSVCKTTNPGYSCLCKRLYVDISPDPIHRSGRVCIFGAAGGWIVGLVVMLPFIIGAILIVRHLRHKQKRRFWLSRHFMADNNQMMNSPILFRHGI